MPSSDPVAKRPAFAFGWKRTHRTGPQCPLRSNDTLPVFTSMTCTHKSLPTSPTFFAPFSTPRAPWRAPPGRSAPQRLLFPFLTYWRLSVSSYTWLPVTHKASHKHLYGKISWSESHGVFECFHMSARRFCAELGC